MLRNTIPWLIAACAGSVIIAAYFVPSAQGWQDTIGQWFEVLASFAFVLGGGEPGDAEPAEDLGP